MNTPVASDALAELQIERLAASEVDSPRRHQRVASVGGAAMAAAVAAFNAVVNEQLMSADSSTTVRR